MGLSSLQAIKWENLQSQLSHGLAFFKTSNFDQAILLLLWPKSNDIVSIETICLRSDLLSIVKIFLSYTVHLVHSINLQLHYFFPILPFTKDI